MTKQSEQIQRVRDRIDSFVIQFMRECLATDPNFTIQELVDYVAREGRWLLPTSLPASPHRILQLLRREGRFDYEMTNRRKSQYKVTAVYDPLQPEKTQPEKTQPKAYTVMAMCHVLMNEKIGSDDKFLALTTLAETLFPDKPIFQDIADALDSPPSSEEIDAAIAEFASMANIAGHQGSDEGPFWAAVACIEWALGRPSTVDYVPCYVSCTLKDALKDLGQR